MSPTGRLLNRPAAVTSSAPPGLYALGLDPARDSYLYVPAQYRVESPAPLIVMLHGAGGHGQRNLSVLQALADESGVLFLAPSSRRQSWDLIVSQYGEDVAMLDQALAYVFTRYAIDSTRLVLGGFSDGASYALSLGLTNGDLFSHLVAYSPGFMAPAAQRGKPAIYISHGKSDPILPIHRCSHRIVPALEQAGYRVRYHEFAGGHTVPPEIASEALSWVLGTSPGRDAL